MEAITLASRHLPLLSEPVVSILFWVLLAIVIVPLFILSIVIFFYPAYLLDLLAQKMKVRFPKLAESKKIRTTFAVISIGLFLLWLQLIGSVYDHYFLA